MLVVDIVDIHPVAIVVPARNHYLTASLTSASMRSEDENKRILILKNWQNSYLLD